MPPEKFLALLKGALVALSLCLACAVTPDSNALAEGGQGAGLDSPTDRYIVLYRDGADLSSELRDQRDAGVVVEDTFRFALKGFVAELSSRDLENLQSDPNVIKVVRDGVVKASSLTPRDTPADSWGLDRIDQRSLPLNGRLSTAQNGFGVDAYIIDTGIRADHAEFGGRVSSTGFNAVSTDPNDWNDCYGHGTHVAGTVAGNTFGVAPQANLTAVRVLDCGGRGLWSWVIAGIDWMVSHHNAGEPAVANLSLGGAANGAVNAAVEGAVADGIAVAVSAGNSSMSACAFSPAAAPSAITVGATNNTDGRAGFSNFGRCVDIFAPGQDIRSAWNGSPTETRLLSGTSMASPHVAGAAALLLSEDPGLTPSQVSSTLGSRSTTGVVINAGYRSPNRLVFAGDPSSPNPIPEPPQPPLPPVPGNDLFANATEIDTSSSQSGVLQGNTEMATKEADEPSFGLYGSGSVWFKLTARESGLVRLKTKGSSFDTVLAVFKGDALGNLKTILDRDQCLYSGYWWNWECGSFGTRQGQTYYIAVDGFLGASGDYALQWESHPKAAPENDDFDNATELTDLSPVIGSTEGASREPIERNHAGYGGSASIWYRWRAPRSGAVDLNTKGSDFNTLLAVYQGSFLNSPKVWANDNWQQKTWSRVRFYAIAGREYRIAVDGSNLQTGMSRLSGHYLDSTPANDNFADAAVLDSSGTVTGTTVNASQEQTEKPDGYFRDASSVWFRWTAPETQVVEFNTRGSDFDTTLSVWTGSQLGGLSQIQENDDSSNAWCNSCSPGSWSRLLFTAMKGTTYSILVAGWYGDEGNLRLNFGTPGTVTSENPSANRYIVLYRDGADLSAEIQDQRQAGVEIDDTFRHAVKGFVADLSAKELSRLHSDPAVTKIVPDGIVKASALEPRDTLAGSWGLDRIDQRSLPLNGRLSTAQNGFGVDAYIIDTGFRADHTEFAGRVSPTGFNATSDTANGWNDCHGHGTHVAGTVAGSTYGVAPQANLTAVRVLGCNGSGYWSWVIAGIDWMVAQHDVGEPAVANLSLGGDFDAAVNAAIEGAVADGISVAVAAGNASADACAYSPAAAPNAITVGSTDNDDRRSSFSNFGRCVDLFAPGRNIKSAWNSSASDTNTISGTSMASPHVAGAAALLLSENPGLTPTQISSSLGSRSTTGVITDLSRSSPNRLLFSGDPATPNPLPEPPALSAPTNDNFASAIELTAPGEVTGNTEMASTEPGEPSHGYRSSNSVWYRWRAPSSGVVSLRTKGSDFDTQLAVYSGDAFGNLSRVAENDACYSSGWWWLWSCAHFTAVPGTTYYFAIAGWSGASGNYVLKTMAPSSARPVNDDFANATALSTLDLTEGSTEGAGRETGEPDHGREGGAGSVWYRWRAPRTGVIDLSTQGSDFNTLLGVYAGDSVNGLSRVWSNDDWRDKTWSGVRFSAVSGQEYRIAVDGRVGNVGDRSDGDFRLSGHYLSDPPPANDNLADAIRIESTGSLTGSNLDASQELGEPSYPSRSSLNLGTIWYRWVATADGVVSFSTKGSSFDTTLTVWRGSGLDSLQPLGANDDASGVEPAHRGLWSRVQVYLLEGQEAYISVGGSEFAEGDVTLNVIAPLAAPSITSGPSGWSNSSTHSFHFSGESSSIFRCRMDSQPESTCSSPATYENLSDGQHDFRVSQIDPGGTSSTDRVRIFYIDTVAPSAPSITSGPADFSAYKSAVITFSGESDTSLECRLDLFNWNSCSNERRFEGLSDGEHTFRVRQVDRAGNYSNVTLKRWTIDSVAPEAPTITSGPTGLITRKSASFAFQGEEAASFLCAIDSLVWVNCTSGKTLTDLSEGDHTFSVKQIDRARNTSLVASRSWTVDSVAPSEPDIRSGPSGFKSSDSAIFTIFGESGARLECQLDSAGWGLCATRKSYSSLSEGLHIFETRQTDPAGHVSETALRTWTIDTENPDLSGVRIVRRKPSYIFSITASDSGSGATRVGFSSSKSKPSPDTNPKTTFPLSSGQLTLKLTSTPTYARVRDAAGNWSRWTAVSG